jgi:hypothetical protein
MSVVSSQLLGCVIRLVKRELDVWKASAVAGAAAGAGSAAVSTNVERVIEAKTAAVQELQKLCDGGLNEESQEKQIVAALLAGVKALFKGFCDPAILTVASPSALASSLSLEVSNSLRKTLKSSRESLKAAPREAILAALPALQRGSGEDTESKMVHLIEYFVEEVCANTWGNDDPWGDQEIEGKWNVFSPLVKVAGAGNVALASIVLTQAKTTDVSEAAYNAYIFGHSDVFELLIENERCLSTRTTRMPLSIRLLRDLHGDYGPSDDPTVPRRRIMVEHFLRRWPQTVKDRVLVREEWQGPLSLAVARREVQLTRLILELAPKSICFEQKGSIIRGEVTYPTLKYALSSPCAAIVRMLIHAGALAMERYNSLALETLCDSRALFVACGFPLKPKYEEKYKQLTSYRQDIRSYMDLLLATPVLTFCLGSNIAIKVLVQDRECIMDEESAISFLLKFQAAGIDIIHEREEEVGTPHAFTLVHLAAFLGYSKLLDWAIDLQGPAYVDASYRGQEQSGRIVMRTPLAAALRHKQVDTALHLLQHHKATAAYKSDDFEGPDQPVMYTIHWQDDEAALPVVKELIKRDASLCDLDCYRSHGSNGSVNPISECYNYNLIRCLETLLSAGLPGVQELCAQEHTLTVRAGEYSANVIATAAWMAAARAHWEALALLLHYCPRISVVSPVKPVESHGNCARNFPSVEELVMASEASRSIKVQVEAKAQKERAEKKKAEAVAATSVMPSNIFEEPGRKVSTEAQEKKKARKKAAKKRAKEKKKAARGGAGGTAADEGSDSDSSGTGEEEAGMDEEEKMLARAPTFDLEKEKAARKARAAAEAEGEAKK